MSEIKEDKKPKDPVQSAMQKLFDAEQKEKALAVEKLAIETYKAKQVYFGLRSQLIDAEAAHNLVRKTTFTPFD